MAETLGQAILELRTDDSALYAGMARAKAGAQDLDRSFAQAGDSAGRSLDGVATSAKGAGAAAAGMASQAQLSARAAVDLGAGFGAVAAQAQLSTLAMRETLVVARELARGNFTRIPGSLTLLAQGVASQGGIGAFATQILKTIGVIQILQNAELAEEAVSAASSAAAVEGAARRAGANILAADTQKALADSAVYTATTANEAAAAQTRLAAANEAVALASREAIIAEDALAAAQERAAVAGAASAAATTTSITALGVELTAVAAIAALAFGVWLIERLTDTGRAVDKLVEKMDENYRKTLLQKEANDAWAASLDGVADAMDKLATKTAADFTTPAIEQNNALADAQKKLTGELKQQADAQKALAAAEALRRNPNISTQAIKAQEDEARKQLASANAAIANTRRDLENLSIASAASQAQLANDLSAALTQRVDDAEAAIKRIATNSGAIGSAVRASVFPEVDALEKLRSSFNDAANSSDAVKDKASQMKNQMVSLIAQLQQGAIGPKEFSKSILGMASALEAMAEAAKKTKDPIAAFKQAVIGAEGLGPNRMGSSASGFGQFMPATFAQYFKQAYGNPNDLTDKQIAGLRDNRQVAEGVIDTAAKDYATALKAAGQNITEASLYTVHLLSAGDPKIRTALKLLAAPAGESTSDFLSAAVLKGNPFLKGTAGDARAAIAKRIGDSDSSVSSGAAAVDKAIADEKQKALRQQETFDQEKARLDGEALTALGKIQTGYQAVAAAATAKVQEEHDAEAKKIAANLAEGKYGEATSQLAQTRARELQDANDAAALQRKAAIALAAYEKSLTEQQAGFDQKKGFLLDDLKFADEFARSNKEKRALELQMLDIQYQQKEYDLQKLKWTQELAGDLEAAARTQAEINRLAVDQAHDQARVKHATMSPFDQYIDQLKTQTADLGSVFQQTGLDGLNAFNSGLLQLLQNAHSFGDFWRGLPGIIHAAAAKILADLLALAEKEAILAIFKSFAGGGGGGLPIPGLGGSEPTSLGLPDTLSGGGDLSSIAGSIPGLAGGGIMGIGGLGGVDSNVLSINGIARARVSADETIAVLPRSLTSRAANDGGHVSVTNFNDFRGADAESVAAISSRIDRMESDLPGKVVSTMQDARQRFIWR